MGKVTTVRSRDYSYNKVYFYRDISSYYMAQIRELHVLPSHLENRLNVPPQFLARVQEDSSKGKENICRALELFASISPSLIKLLQTKSIQANFGGFHTSSPSQK